MDEQRRVEDDSTQSVGSSQPSDTTDEEKFEKKGKRGCTGRSIFKLCILCGFIATVVVAFTIFKVHEKFPGLLEWIQMHKEAGFFIFVLVYAVATILFIPGAILALGGGFVFGLYIGTLAVWVGGTIGQTIAFLLGRFLLRDCVKSKTRRFRIWRAIEHVAKDQGWKIVALLRLAPIIPYDALNYAFGITAVKFWQYFLASSIAIVPGSLLYVYFGNLADCIVQIANGDLSMASTTLIVTVTVSGVAIFLVVALGTYYARKALKKIIEEEKAADEVNELPTSLESRSSGDRPQFTDLDSAKNINETDAKIPTQNGLFNADNVQNGGGDIELGIPRVDTANEMQNSITHR